MTNFYVGRHGAFTCDYCGKTKSDHEKAELDGGVAIWRCLDADADPSAHPERIRRMRRPMIRWHGGKWRIAPWILSFFPPHRIYVEPYGGGGSILLRKARSHAEIYNDLDGEVVNLFRMARDRGPELLQAVELTPFAREEHEHAYEPAGGELERARRLLVRGWFGVGGNCATKNSGFRCKVIGRRTHPSSDWRNFPEALRAIIDRLRGVVIESRPAVDVMQKQDTEETLHYVDPPYVFSTRADLSKDYAHEMTDAQHVELAKVLHSLRGAVILSGYDSPLYQELYGDWQRRELDTLADRGLKRTEVLWIKNAGMLV